MPLAITSGRSGDGSEQQPLTPTPEVASPVALAPAAPAPAAAAAPAPAPEPLPQTKAGGKLFGDPSAADYYDRLGLGRTATKEDIERAFRRQSKHVHPDKHPMFKGQAELYFQNLNEAYQTLSDATLRREYDREYPPGSAPPAPPSAAPPAQEEKESDASPPPQADEAAEEDSKEKTFVPVRRVRRGDGCWIGCLRDCHVLAILISGALWALLGLLVACKLGGAGCQVVESNRSFPFWAGFGVILLVYCYEVLRSPEWFFLAHIKPAESATEYIERLKATPPSIYWDLTAYHMQTMEHETMEEFRDEQGRVQQRLRKESYEERVNTHTARCLVQVSAWDDISEPLSINLQDYEVTKILFEKKFSFADHESKMRYEEKKQKFIQLNSKDTHYDLTTSFEIPGFEPRILAAAHPGLMPEKLRLQWFVLASLCLLTVPYRLWFSSITGACTHCIHKRLRVQPKIKG